MFGGVVGFCDQANKKQLVGCLFLLFGTLMVVTAMATYDWVVGKETVDGVLVHRSAGLLFVSVFDGGLSDSLLAHKADGKVYSCY